MKIKHTNTRKLTLLAFAVALILVAVVIWRNQSARASDCPTDWYNSADSEVRDLCAQEKLHVTIQSQEAVWSQKEQEPYYQTLPGSHPVVLLPQPDDTKIIREAQLDSPNPAERQGRPAMLEGATSLWQAGSVPNNDYTDWNGLMVVTYIGNGLGNTERYTNDNNPGLVAYVADGDQSLTAKYGRDWTCPKPIGKIRITNITRKDGTLGAGAAPPNFSGLNYVVSFTNDGAAGGLVTGNFDMTTETWTFTIPTSESISDPGEPLISP